MEYHAEQQFHAAEKRRIGKRKANLHRGPYFGYGRYAVGKQLESEQGEVYENANPGPETPLQCTNEIP